MLTQSLGGVLERQKGFGPGFDFARVFLAVSVLLWHSEWLVIGNDSIWDATPAWIYDLSILPMFFPLSGFLIAGSAQRLSLGNFALNRGLRIVPALMVEVVLSALVLGPLVTAVPLHEYFGSRHFGAYFLNIIGYVHFGLPGVFLDNPSRNVVNGSLWTVPFELLCYVVMAGLIVISALKKPALLLGATIAWCLIGVALFAAASLHPELHMLQALNHHGRGAALLPCFLIGTVCYVFRDRVPYDARIFWVCLVALGLIGWFVKAAVWQSGAVLIAAPVLTYIVIFIGLTEIPRLPYFSRGDYSYGIYLYGFPLQQTLIYLFPTFKNVPLFFVVSLVCATALASVSWHFIERPILKLRKNFSFVSRKQHNAALGPIALPLPGHPAGADLAPAAAHPD